MRTNIVRTYLVKRNVFYFISVLLIFVTFRPQGVFAEDSCYRAPIQNPPLWMSSAVWVSRKSEIAVIDASRNALLLYTPTGKSSADPLKLKSTAPFLPALLLEHGEGYLLKMVGSRLLWLDGNLELAREANFSVTGSKSGQGVRSIFQWASAGNRILAYGSIAQAEGVKPYQMGFFHASPEDPAQVRMLKPFDNADYYVLGQPYLADLDEASYFLAMTPSPKIYEIPHQSNRVRPLLAFPLEFQSVPSLKTKIEGPETAVPLYREIETLKIPAGLYGYKNSLYVLTRQPGNGGTIWSLFQVDPARDKVGPELRLPTTANHLTVVPGPDFWYFFERGAVEFFGKQNVSSFVALPSSWLTSAASPLNINNLKVGTCPTQGQR